MATRVTQAVASKTATTAASKSSLAATMHRQLLKAVKGVDKYYEGNIQHVLQSIVGMRIDASSLTPYEPPAAPTKSKQRPPLKTSTPFKPGGALALTSVFFRGCVRQHQLNSTPLEVGINKVFWLLRQLQLAIPPKDGEESAGFVKRTTILEFVGPQLQPIGGPLAVLAVSPADGGTLPLPRHAIPTDPVWLLQLSKAESCPLLREMLAIESFRAAGKKPYEFFQFLRTSKLDDAAAQEQFRSLPTTTTTETQGTVEISCRTGYVGVLSKESGRAIEPLADEDADDEEDGERADDEEVVKDTAFFKNKAAQEQHVFHYFIAIRNTSRVPMTVQCISRHWLFVDVENGVTQEVVGAGVVGQFPILAPGESHVYTSGTTVSGRHGYMKGAFQMLVLPSEASSIPNVVSMREKRRGGDKKRASAKAEAETETVTAAEVFNANISATRFSVTENALDVKVYDGRARSASQRK